MICALYRQYDENGLLLYVGVSLNAMARLVQHRDRSIWFAQIRRVDIKYFKSRAAALRAETRAIERERPKFNVNKLPKPQPMAADVSDVDPPLWFDDVWPKGPCGSYALAVRVPEFCAVFGLSEADYRNLKARGRGPREIVLGPRTIRISRNEAADFAKRCRQPRQVIR